MPNASGSRSFFAGIVAGLLLLAAFAIPLRERALAGQNDFVGLYVGARLVNTPDLYSATAARRIQFEITEGKAHFPALSFIRLPFYAVLLSPLGRLPYPTAYAIFQAVNLAAIAALLFLAYRMYPDVLVLAAFSIPLLIAFANGQDVAIVAALAIGAYLLAAGGRDFAAGLLLSLGAIKIHLFVLVPVALILHRRWRFLAGGVCGGAALTGLCFLGGGLDWPGRMFVMLSDPEVHPGAEGMTTFRNLVWWIAGREDTALELAMIATGVAAFCYMAWRIRDFRAVYALALAGGLLVSHHAYHHDLAILLAVVPLAMTSAASKLTKSLTTIAALPTTSLMMLAGAPVSAGVPLLLCGVLLSGLRRADSPP